MLASSYRRFALYRLHLNINLRSFGSLVAAVKVTSPEPLDSPP